MRLAAATAAIALALVATACGGSDAPAPQLSATGAWARTTPTGATNGVVYLTLTSPATDAIVGASVESSVAASTELHETMGVNGGAMANMPGMGGGTGEMTMTPLDSVPLPAGKPVAFEPGGKHIMLVGLAAPLVSGRHFTLTLTMVSGSTLPVDVVVADNAP